MIQKKLLIINQHFSVGGIKRSLENLIPVLKRNYDVKVIFLCGEIKKFNNKYPDTLIESPFILSSLLSSLKDIKNMNYKYLRIVIKIIGFVLSKVFGMEKIVNFSIRCSKNLGKYDCVISYSHDNWFENGNFFGGGNYLAIHKTQSNKKIAWIHGELSTIGLTKDRLFKTYSLFNYVITVSEACKRQFDLLSNNKIICKRIYNLSNIANIQNKIKGYKYKADKNIFKIVTVGRISKIAKRMDKINEIAKKLKENGYKFKWTIIGNGSEYENCINIAKCYGITDVVEYLGEKSNPYIYMLQSDLFVLVSDTESMSMVIRESLIVGTPVVTTNFPAAYESIVNGKNGFIVNKDISSLYEKIAYCIEHKEILDNFRDYINKNPLSDDMTIQEILNIIE